MRGRQKKRETDRQREGGRDFGREGEKERAREIMNDRKRMGEFNSRLFGILHMFMITRRILMPHVNDREIHVPLAHISSSTHHIHISHTYFFIHLFLYISY